MSVIGNILAILLMISAPDSLRAIPESLTNGADAPRFWASILSGGDFYLSRKVGDKARLSEKTGLVLSFFTASCIPCRQEIPFLDSLRAEFPRVAIYLVNIGEEPQIVKNYVQKMHYKLPVLIDRYGQIAKKYQADTTPTLVGISPDGKITFLKRGFREGDRDFIRQQIAALADMITDGK